MGREIRFALLSPSERPVRRHGLGWGSIFFLGKVKIVLAMRNRLRMVKDVTNKTP